MSLTKHIEQPRIPKHFRAMSSWISFISLQSCLEMGTSLNTYIVKQSASGASGFIRPALCLSHAAVLAVRFFILIRWSSECKFDIAQTSQTSGQNLTIYSYAQHVFLPGSSRHSTSNDQNLLSGHGGSLTLSHPSFLLSSPSPRFWIQTFSSFFFSSQSVVWVVFSLREAPEWFSIFTEWHALIGANSESVLRSAARRHWVTLHLGCAQCNRRCLKISNMQSKI